MSMVAVVSDDMSAAPSVTCVDGADNGADDWVGEDAANETAGD
jgi:hypothetical protein